MQETSCEEKKRLSKNWEEPFSSWNRWGAYVSERAWGTVREDYSENGDPWRYFPHDIARKKVYRWGEDAIAGWCDRYQILLFAPAFWNGVDPILKERLFGLSSPEGNHGEDVKECYYHLEATPSHSYMKYLYRYPQKSFPYESLTKENHLRGTGDPEFEIYDTDVFDEGRYFDIIIEYAKKSPEDVCIRMTAKNCGNNSAPLHIIPQLWFRNQWDFEETPLPKPRIRNAQISQEFLCFIADDSEALSPRSLGFDYHLGPRYFYAPLGGTALFTDNADRSYCRFQKDGFHSEIIGKKKSTNPDEIGTKACVHYFFSNIFPGKSVVLDFSLTNTPQKNPFENIEDIFSLRKKEADEFYQSLLIKKNSSELREIQRQAISGLIWNKQIYLYDVDLWLKGDDNRYPPPPSRYGIRNVHWRHLNSMRIMSMPDKWEYPWFAAWDLAFQAISFAIVDIGFAKNQLWLLLFDQFQHPSGHIPACEWEFSDLNPPIQAWAIFHVYEMENKREGKKDREFLEKCFHKLLMNFSWWVNKVDSSGNDVFEGGFLGLDNIAIFDRSQAIAGDARLQQSDGTGWMAMFTLNMMRIALELAKENKVYESLATKFFQHFAYIAAAIKERGSGKYPLWNDADGFFYDILAYPSGSHATFRVRSMVGIIPFFACTVYEQKELENLKEFHENFQWFIKHRKDLVEGCLAFGSNGGVEQILFMPMNEKQRHSILQYVWNGEEFRAPFGIRSLSKHHEKHPFIFADRVLHYEPSESQARIKGGNSNWRGPIWIQMNFLLLEAIHRLERFYGEKYEVRVPDLPAVSLKQMRVEIAESLTSLFCKNQEGRRPCLGKRSCFLKDKRFQEHILFYEYFNPETGEGLGASHQTGWTALIANIIDELLD